MPTGPSNINSGATIYDRASNEDLHLNSNQGLIELFETPEQQPSVEANSINVTVSDNCTPVESVFTALKSVVPKSITEDDIPGSSVTPPEPQIFTSSLHRQILFSVANNFAGMDAFPIKHIFHFLGKETIKHFCQLERSCSPALSSRAIFQNMFRGAIEAGDTIIVDVLLCESPKKIDVNSQFCFFKGNKYTPIERASMLRYHGVVKTLLLHGAVVNRTPTDSPQLLCGALNYVVGFHCDEAKPKVDTQLFRILLEAGGELSYPAMISLIRNGEGELVALFMSVNSGRHAIDWSHWDVIDYLITYLDDDASVETITTMLKYGVHLKFDAYSDCFGDVLNPRRLIDVAAERGMLGTVKLLHDNRVSLTGDTLPCAIASGNQDLIKFVFALGADIRCIAPSGTTPFAAAIRLQEPHVLQLLESHSPWSLMQEEEHFSAALKAAAEAENIPFIEKLIHLGGKVSSEDLGRALSVAIKNGRDDLAKEMIDLGADVSMDCTESGPPLLEALKRQNEALVLSLLDADADPNYGRVQKGDRRANKEPSIALAVKWANHSVIENLIFAGADVNDCTTHPNSDAPLTIAVMGRDRDMIIFLLGLGADINNPETRKYGGTALEAAVESGVEMARFLLRNGADPNDSWALQKAIFSHEKVLDFLLKRWRVSYPMQKGDFGIRVLAEAVVTGSERVIRLMLENGVSAEVMVCIDGESATPFGHAIAKQQANFTGCLELFLKKGCKANGVVAEASRSRFYPGASERFTIQQDHGFTPRPRITALLAAIDTRNISTVQLMIRHGGDVNFPARGRIKRTPLQRAAEIGSLDIVDLLLNYCANVNAPAAERCGGTALQLAAIGGYIPIACKLLSHGADPNAPASRENGRTALEGAAEHGRLDMVKVLLNGGAGSGPDHEAQVASAIALAMDKGHLPICELLESHLRSREQGSGLELSPGENTGGLTNFDFDPDSIFYPDPLGGIYY